MRTSLKTMVVGLLIISCAVAAVAADCSSYLNRHGYCTDYVYQRTGKRQSGDAGTWRGNLPNDKAQRGDVLIFRNGGAGHVAVVDRVVYQANTAIVWGYDISEMNYGSWTYPACSVTTNFGKVTQRRVTLSSVSAVWHP